MTTDYQRHGTVAVITLNNPPVNAMNLATRVAFVDGIHKALHDDAVKAIVITGAGKVFSGGADIKEFGTPAMLAEPNLHMMIGEVENATKPVIAAIHTLCIGGGLELSLACHYRVATPTALCGLPEVQLGLLPGAGGTQRLPRAVGLERGLAMIVSGVPVEAEKLADTALFNQMIKGDLLQDAITFAESIADIRPLPKIRDISMDHANAEAILQTMRDKIAAKADAFPAPGKCVDAIAATLTQSFDDGIRLESQFFIELLLSPESKALREAFFSERAAKKQGA